MSDKCPSCNGRGGFGRSIGGVSMSYVKCPTCDGEGTFLSEAVLSAKDNVDAQDLCINVRFD